MRTLCILTLTTLAACPSPRSPQRATSPDPTMCDRADDQLAEAAELQAEGYLGRALPHVEEALELCPSDRTRAAHDAARAELWIDEAALAGYASDSTDDQRSDARLLYQAGQLLRVIDENFDLSLRRFEESYATWPHPLTIVQMGLTQQAAGNAMGLLTLGERYESVGV